MPTQVSSGVRFVRYKRSDLTINVGHVVDGLVRTDSEAGVLLQTTNTSVVLLGFSGM